MHIKNQKKKTIIHTGAWGTGAFKNSLYMTSAIQMLAAEIAKNIYPDHNLEIIFHLKEPQDMSAILNIISENKKQRESDAHDRQTTIQDALNYLEKNGKITASKWSPQV